MIRAIALHTRTTKVFRQVAIYSAAALLLLTVSGAARAETPAGCRAGPQGFDWTEPAGFDPYRLQLVYYRCTFYDEDIARVAENAREWIAFRASSVRHPAVVLDIDETSLSNWKVLYQNKFVYVAKGPCDFSKGSTCGENTWEKSARAPAIKPTLELFNAARRQHVAVFFVTGRSDNAAERSATATNLHRAGYDGWQRLYLRQKKFSEPSVVPYKSWARSDIEAGGYTIIANVGDQWSDLDNGYSERIFKLPNPFYYLP